MNDRTALIPTPDGRRAGSDLPGAGLVASVVERQLGLTDISIDLGTTSSQLTWIADGYTVALAALVLPFGALGDRFGRRTLLLIGAIGFGLASMAASLAQSPQVLIGCRVAMGVGAAMIMPGTLSTITAVCFAANRRGPGRQCGQVSPARARILGLLTCGLVLEWFTCAPVRRDRRPPQSPSSESLWLAPNTSDREEATIDLLGYVLSAPESARSCSQSSTPRSWMVCADRCLRFRGRLRVPRGICRMGVAHTDARARRGCSHCEGSEPDRGAHRVQFLCLFGFLVGLHMSSIGARLQRPFTAP